MATENIPATVYEATLIEKHKSFEDVSEPLSKKTQPAALHFGILISCVFNQSSLVWGLSLYKYQEKLYSSQLFSF